MHQKKGNVTTNLLDFRRTRAPPSSDGLALPLVAEEGGDLQPVGDQEDGQRPRATRGQQEGTRGPNVIVLSLLSGELGWTTY